MRIIENLSIRNKLLLLLVILLLPLTYFVVNSIWIELENASVLEEQYVNLEETGKFAEALHHIQKERALSYGYMTTGRKRFSDSLAEQRQLTNKALADLADLSQKYNLNSDAIGDQTILNRKRKEIDALTLDSLEFENYFEEIITNLYKNLNINILLINDTQIKNQLDAYLNLLEIKFYLAQIRTIFTKSILSGQVSTESLISISAKKSLLETSQNAFISESNPEVFAYFQEKTSNETRQLVFDFLEKKLLSKNADLSDEDLVFWYETYTAYINQIDDVDGFTISYLQDVLSEHKNSATQRLIFYITLIALMFALAVWLSVYIIKRHVAAINQLKEAAKEVAAGETNITIPVVSKDEIGNLAYSFQAVIEKNNHLTEVAELIGKGNYDAEIKVSSERDVLSHALQKMKENLRLLSSKEKSSNWMLTGVEELSDLLRGDRSLYSVSKKVLSHTSQYIQAEIGAFYLMNEQSRLERVAAYGFSDRDREDPNPSDTLVGQALKNQKILRLANVSEADLQIKTGFTVSAPVEIVLVPLIVQEQEVGVLEFAVREKMSEAKIAYLERIVEKIAVAILTLQADIKTAELLNETQTQSEELETQQEELRQMNLELIAQKDKLQQSEEELKANHEELEEKNAELEEKAKLLEEHFEAITHKNKQLEEARNAIQVQLDELHRVGKYRSDFLANMSHELRTPLNSILILAKLIAENKEKNLSPKQVEFAEVIHNSGNDLLKLINEILDLTKIEAGKLSLEVKKFPVKNLNPDLLFKELAKEKNIRFDINFHENLPQHIISDQFRIEQILKNLLSNAFKFTKEEGTVSLDVFVPDVKVHFRSESLSNAPTVIAFAVCDTGLGISEEEQNIIFDAFKQADSSTTRKYGGTGLGLSICKELAGLLGGEIHLKSEVKKGSCFTLYIPEEIEIQTGDESEIREDIHVTEITAKEKDAVSVVFDAVDKPKASDKEKTILIIEDDRGFSKILADFAIGRHIKPVTTHEGKEGLKLAKEIIPDAILLDINLPDISGWDILDALKQDDALKHIPVHIMSAYELDPAKKDLPQENYLPKPVTLENLDKAFFNISSINKSTVKKVLIVEDNKVEATAVKELLFAHEVHAEIANDGEEAFNMLSKEKYDCIILDLNMPGMGGYEILDRLKNNNKYADIPVIIYSGKDFSEEEEFKLKKYVNAIVIKTDYSYKRLMDEVKLFLHKVQERLPTSEPKKVYRSDESLKNKKVLIVDDDSRNIYSLYNAFEAEAMQIVVANNGKEALAKLEENPDINIVLMDIMMPEMDGLECTRKIRAQKNFNNLPIIAVTAKAMKEDKEKCLEAGASDYITKPVNVEKLISLMRVWVYKSENIRLY